MSHEAPQPYPIQPIDTDRPYLVPRSSGNIDVWVVKTHEDGTPVYDEQGFVELGPQKNERAKYEAQGLVAPHKAAHPDALTDEVQGYYADILGQSRPNATPEQFERYAHLEDDLAETALEAIGLDDEQEDDGAHHALISEFFEEAPLKAIGDLMQQVRARTDMVGQELDHLESMLSRIQYEGGNAGSVANELRDSYESLQRLVLGDGPESDLSLKVSRLSSQAEEMNEAIRRSETASEKARFENRKIEDAMAEMHAANFTIVRGYDEIRTTLTPHGQFESYLEELLQTPQGYEYTIALLKSKITEMYDDAMMVRSRTVMLERAVEDLERLKNA